MGRRDDEDPGLLEELRWAPLDDPSVLRKAVAALADHRRELAVAAAARLRTPEAFDVLEAIARAETDPEVVTALVRLMVEAGEHDRVLRLCVVTDGDSAARLYGTLVEMADSLASEQRAWLLMRVLTDARVLPGARELALQSLLPALAQAEAVELMARLLADGRAPPNLVEFVLWGHLDGLSPPARVGLLTRLVSQDDVRLRLLAYVQVERTGVRDVLPALHARLGGEPDPEEILPLARTLAHLADRRAEALLLGLVERSTGARRSAALRALAEVASGQVVPLLKALADGAKAAFAAEAGAASKRIGERHAHRRGSLSLATPGHGGLSVATSEGGQLALAGGEGGELSLAGEGDASSAAQDSPNLDLTREE